MRGIRYSAGSKHGRLETCLIETAGESDFDLVVIGAPRPRGRPRPTIANGARQASSRPTRAVGHHSASGGRLLMAVAEEAYSPAGAHEDAAYLRIAMSLPANDLRAFLDDVERLYRINPLLEISAFEPAGRRTQLFERQQCRYPACRHGQGNGTRDRLQPRPEGRHASPRRGEARWIAPASRRCLWWRFEQRAPFARGRS